MDKKNIVIADFNEEYLAALEFEFVKNLEQSVDIHIITDEKYFNEYFGMPQKIDILIIDEALVHETIIKQNISKIFMLSESEEKVSDVNIGNKRIYHLYRYDNVKENYHKVMGQTNLAVHNTAGMVKNTPKTNVITVYSPVGGSGVTVAALGICCAMKKLGKRVLYIDTNTLQNFDCYFMNKDCPSHSSAADRIKTVFYCHIIIRDNMLHSDAFHLRHLCGHLKVHDITGIILNNHKHTSIGCDCLNALIDLIRSRGGKDRSRNCGI